MIFSDQIKEYLQSFKVQLKLLNIIDYHLEYAKYDFTLYTPASPDSMFSTLKDFTKIRFQFDIKTHIDYEEIKKATIQYIKKKKAQTI